MEEIGNIEINENMVERRIIHRGNRWRIIIVYSREIKETMDIITERIEEEEEECLLIMGDFNARTGEEGGPIQEEEEEEYKKGRRQNRKSVDKVINREGKILMERIEERGWMILNGSGNREGGWTYIGGAGTSVIDYVIVNEKAREAIIEVREGERTKSDHMPLEVFIKGEEKREEHEGEEEKEKERNDWSEEGIVYFREKLGDWTSRKEEREELWKEISDNVRGAIKKKKVKIRKWKLGKRKWHDGEWRMNKRKLRKILRRVRNGKEPKEEYLKEKREYRRWCEERKEKHEEEEEEKIDKIKTEAEA